MNLSVTVRGDCVRCAVRWGVRESVPSGQYPAVREDWEGGEAEGSPAGGRLQASWCLWES